MKKFIITAALAVAVASPAFAASSRHVRNSASAEQSFAQAAPGQGFYAVDRDTVVSGGAVLGRDPDAFIRQQMLRVGNINDVGGN